MVEILREGEKEIAKGNFKSIAINQRDWLLICLRKRINYLSL